MEELPSTMEATEASDQRYFEPIEEIQKPEAKPRLSPHLNSDPAQPASSKSPSHPPIPSTETTSMSVPPTTNTKKKGTASTVKRAPKRPKNGPSKANKKPKSDIPTDGLNSEEAPASEDDEAEGEEESDHGPYCICRGPDDHRWMICCENCEDWFHGECINLNKDIGESLIEKFVCPNCTDRKIYTLYKKTCALGGCRRASRLNQPEKSVFCSHEHSQMYWERLVAKLPKSRGKGGLSDQLIQEEFMALLGSGLAGTDEEGLWNLAREPFSNTSLKDGEIGMLRLISLQIRL